MDIFTIMENKNFYVYKITNLINNKIYIGKTNNIEKRFKSHIIIANGGPIKYKNSFSVIHKAIIKYGKENFIIEMLSEHDNEKESLLSEIDFIKKFNSNNNKIGYNCTLGGDGTSGHKRTKESIAKFIASRTGVLHTEETKKKMSEIHKGKPYYGNGDIATRQKVSEMFKGENGPNVKLTTIEVTEIKKLLIKGISHREIAQIFNVGKTIIGDIKSGRCWSHVNL